VIRKAVFRRPVWERASFSTKAQPRKAPAGRQAQSFSYGVEEPSRRIATSSRDGTRQERDRRSLRRLRRTRIVFEARGKREQLDQIRRISSLINFAYVRQGEPLVSDTPCWSRVNWSATNRSP